MRKQPSGGIPGSGPAAPVDRPPARSRLGRLRIAFVLLVLVVGIVLLRPQPRVAWQQEATIPAQYSCAAGSTAVPRRVQLGPRAMTIVECISSGAPPTIAEVKSPGHYEPESHRIALYLAGPRWRLFDVDLTNGTIAGFATDRGADDD